MKIIFTWKSLVLQKGEDTVGRYPASCSVRHELNGRRALHTEKEVRWTFPDEGHRKPYMPRQFPSGIFKVTAVVYTDDPEYAPVKIRTTATRDVFTWELDIMGGYERQTNKVQTDTQYHIHYTDSKTTLGCIRCDSKSDIITLAELIKPAVDRGEDVWLEVL